MWETPTEIDNDLIQFSKHLNCDWIGAVSVISESAYNYDNCHNNVYIHTNLYGGQSIVGWYFLKGFKTIQAIRHTIWKNSKQLIDVTPYKDNREFIMFGRSKNQTKDYSISNCYFQFPAKYIQEAEIMYYVYQLVDPRNNQPFYIGKGKGNRAKTHLWEISDENQYKANKIAAIREDGLEPKIEYIAENIMDESLAYTIESTMIKKYGRKGYDENGILTNICIDNRPPNHKGKSYKEIYGDRWKEEVEKRRQIQLDRGGFGPKKHTLETRQKIQKAVQGENNPMFGRKQSSKTKELIAKKARLRVGKSNKLSKKHILVSPANEIFEFFGGELRDFCLKNNLSLSTLQKHFYKNLEPPKYGKTKGWRLK